MRKLNLLVVFIILISLVTADLRSFDPKTDLGVEINQSSYENGENADMKIIKLPNNGRKIYYPAEIRDKVRDRLENKVSEYMCVEYSIDKNSKRDIQGLNLSYDGAYLYARKEIFCQGDPSDKYIMGGYTEVLDTTHILENPITYFGYKLSGFIWWFTNLL